MSFATLTEEGGKSYAVNPAHVKLVTREESDDEPTCRVFTTTAKGYIVVKGTLDEVLGALAAGAAGVDDGEGWFTNDDDPLSSPPHYYRSGRSICGEDVVIGKEAGWRRLRIKPFKVCQPCQRALNDGAATALGDPTEEVDEAATCVRDFEECPASFVTKYVSQPFSHTTVWNLMRDLTAMIARELRDEAAMNDPPEDGPRGETAWLVDDDEELATPHAVRDGRALCRKEPRGVWRAPLVRPRIVCARCKEALEKGERNDL